MTTMTTRAVEYPVDGLTMIGHLALPAGVGYHPRHAQRAWRDIVALLAECLPVTD